MTRLDGRTALVAGGASGMGAATARRFVREGANVTIADVDIVRAKDVAAELGANVLVVDLDVR